METLTLNKHDFKKYLLTNLNDCRQDELIFWKKGIPLPVDLIYKIFELRGELFKLYLDHISTYCLFNKSSKIDEISLEEEIKIPSIKYKNQRDSLVYQYNTNYTKLNISDLTNKIAERLMLIEYNFTDLNYVNSICHEGRKYNRIYIPESIKSIINNFDGNILKKFGRTNGDMFGNVVADQLGVYRSGFSDAFAAIFNKLLDFVLDKSTDRVLTVSTASSIKISQVHELKSEYEDLHKGTVIDGSLWEPRYIDAKSTFVLNEKHPYYEIIHEKSGLQVLIDIATESSEIENLVMKESISRIFESYRQDLSRKLRLIAEKG